MKNKIVNVLKENLVSSYRGTALKCAYAGNYILVDTNSDDGVDGVVDSFIEAIINDTPSEELHDKFAIIYENGILDIIDRS